MRYDENTRPSNTESGNAVRLGNLHGEHIRYVAESGWQVFDGRVWKRDLKEVKIMGLAADIPGEIRVEAGQFPSIADEIRKWAFVEECVQTKVGGRVSRNDLFLHYKYWCSRNGHEALSIKDVKRDLA